MEKLDPPPNGGRDVSAFIERTFDPTNASRLRKACRLLSERVLADDTTVGLSLSSPLSPSKEGLSAVVPLLEGGYVDWIVTQGELLCADARLAWNSGPGWPQETTSRQERSRILDLFVSRHDLTNLESFFQKLIVSPHCQKVLSSAELHAILGGYLAERDRLCGAVRPSLLSAAARCSVPVYSATPGGSSLGRLVAAAALSGNRLTLDPNRDVNQMAAIVLQAGTTGRSVVFSLGTGISEQAMLESAGHLEDPLGVSTVRHRFAMRITHVGAAPGDDLDPVTDTVSRPLVDEMEFLRVGTPHALPLLTAHVLENVPPRPLKQLHKSRALLSEILGEAHLRYNLEQQQNSIQEKVRQTGAQIQARMHETQASIQARVHETQANIQAEVTRMQTQMQQQVQRLLLQVKQTTRQDDKKGEE